MRKNLMALFFIALLYAGCNKEKEIVNGNLPAAKSTASALRIDESRMEDAMNHFITLTLHDSAGYCDDYEAQDALLIMEAALNYHTCTPDSGFDAVATDTLTFEMTLIKGGNREFFPNWLMADFWSIILDSVEHAKVRVENRHPEFENAFNVVVDLEFTEFDPVFPGDTQVAVIQVITEVGNYKAADCAWSTNDYWNAMGPPVGYGCGSNSANTSSDIVQKMNAKLNHPCWPYPTNCSYYSHISKKTFSYSQNNPQPFPYCYSANVGAGSAPSYLWYSLNPNDCLSPTDLDCETNGIKALAVDPTYAPSGKTVMGYIFWTGYTIGPPNTIYWHACRITWGICHAINGF